MTENQLGLYGNLGKLLVSKADNEDWTCHRKHKAELAKSIKGILLRDSRLCPWPLGSRSLLHKECLYMDVSGSSCARCS